MLPVPWVGDEDESGSLVGYEDESGSLIGDEDESRRPVGDEGGADRCGGVRRAAAGRGTLDRRHSSRTGRGHGWGKWSFFFRGRECDFVFLLQRRVFFCQWHCLVNRCGMEGNDEYRFMRSSGNRSRGVSQFALRVRFAVHGSPLPVRDFFWASAVHDPEAIREAQKKWPSIEFCLLHF